MRSRILLIQPQISQQENYTKHKSSNAGTSSKTIQQEVDTVDGISASPVSHIDITVDELVSRLWREGKEAVPGRVRGEILAEVQAWLEQHYDRTTGNVMVVPKNSRV